MVVKINYPEIYSPITQNMPLSSVVSVTPLIWNVLDASCIDRYNKGSYRVIVRETLGTLHPYQFSTNGLSVRMPLCPLSSVCHMVKWNYITFLSIIPSTCLLNNRFTAFVISVFLLYWISMYLSNLFNKFYINSIIVSFYVSKLVIIYHV